MDVDFDLPPGRPSFVTRVLGVDSRRFGNGQARLQSIELGPQLVAEARQAEGCAADPTAGVIDKPSVKATESGGVRGYDAGKRNKGRKRHIATDIVVFLVGLAVHGRLVPSVVAQCHRGPSETRRAAPCSRSTQLHPPSAACVVSYRMLAQCNA